MSFKVQLQGSASRFSFKVQLQGSASRFSFKVPGGFQLNQFDEFEFLIVSRQASLGITNSKAAGNIEGLIPF
jgi:hypothetical protein